METSQTWQSGMQKIGEQQYFFDRFQSLFHFFLMYHYFCLIDGLHKLMKTLSTVLVPGGVDCGGRPVHFFQPHQRRH
jgi:hypothetical protein